MIATILLGLSLAPPLGSRAYEGELAVESPPAAMDDLEPAEPPSTTAPSAPADVEAGAPRTVRRRARRRLDHGPRPWLVGAFVDTAYVLNTNFPDNHLSRGAVLTPRANEFTLQTVAISLFHEPIDREPFRLELALHAGAAVEALYAAEPVPGGDDGQFAGPDVWKHIARANVGYRARTGTEIGAGLFASPLGIGGFWSKDNWNYSASWESRAAAFYFAGARLMQALPAGFGLEAWLVNGYQTNADVNHVPSYLAGLTWSDEKWNVAHYVYFGPDDADASPRAWRTLVSNQFTYDAGRVAVAAVWDYGRERLTGLPGEPVALWTGGGAFVRGRVLERKRAALDLAARPEAYLDRDARILGARAWLLSATGTMTLHVLEYLMPRLEYRYDHALGPSGFFYRGQATANDDPRLARSQHSVYLSLVGKFEYAFATRRRRHRHAP